MASELVHERIIRREARLRREYLYRKSVEEQERALYEKKLALKTALKEGRPIPKELREESQALSKELVFDSNIAEPESHVDDEYATASLRAPKIVITTSRDPSSRLGQFAKELRWMFPNSQRINRGNYVLGQLVQTCKDNDFTDLILLHETRGEPDGLIVCHLPYGPTACFSLFNVSLRHDLRKHGFGDMEDESNMKVSEAYPHLIFDGFASSLGKRVQTILTRLFPVPKIDSKRVLTFANQGDFIRTRHHTYGKGSSSKERERERGSNEKEKEKKYGSVDLVEVGPRFEMRLYEIRLGTLDMTEADVEWVLKPYMNSSAKKKNVL